MRFESQISKTSSSGFSFMSFRSILRRMQLHATHIGLRASSNLKIQKPQPQVFHFWDSDPSLGACSCTPHTLNFKPHRQRCWKLDGGADSDTASSKRNQCYPFLTMILNSAYEAILKGYSDTNHWSKYHNSKRNIFQIVGKPHDSTWVCTIRKSWIRVCNICDFGWIFGTDNFQYLKSMLFHVLFNSCHTCSHVENIAYITRHHMDMRFYSVSCSAWLRPKILHKRHDLRCF